MAEALFRKALADRPGFSVVSAGVAALTGRPPEPDAAEVMRGRGLDITSCRARQCDDKLLAEADLVLVMEESQLKWIVGNYPQTRGKVFLIGHWRAAEIVADPFRQPRAAFERALVQLERHVEDWLKVFNK